MDLGAYEFALIEPFIRGDVDGDGLFAGIADALYIFTYGFLDGPSPPCLEAADADGSSSLNALADGLTILNHAFAGGTPPPAPFPNCGDDPDPDGSLGCASQAGCR